MALPDVAAAIGKQVEQVILQAKKDSEARVRQEFASQKQVLRTMQQSIEELSQRVQRCAQAGPTEGNPDVVDRTYLSQRITQLEQKLGTEVQALKQDLHRTILAHNHNSDLMRHHRDAIDEARKKLDARSGPKADQVDGHIAKVETLLRQGQAKQRTVETLSENLTVLEKQVNDMLAVTAGGLGGYPGLGGLGAGDGLVPEAGLNPLDPEFNAEAAFAPAAPDVGGSLPPAGEAPATSFPAPDMLPPGIEQAPAPAPAEAAPAPAPAPQAPEAPAEAEPQPQAGESPGRLRAL